MMDPEYLPAWFVEALRDFAGENLAQFHSFTDEQELNITEEELYYFLGV